MAKKDKELEELLEKFKNVVKELDTNSDGNEEQLKEAKEDGIRMINNSKEAIALATENGVMFAGKYINVMATIATMIHSLISSGEIPEEEVVEVCLRGITDKEKAGETNLERVNLILETLKKITD